MPKLNYCDTSEELKMAECNLSLTYQNVRMEEKLIKLNYSSWCPTCDRDSPRRRTRSETGESCRRKGKDMKTLTPKRYNRHEYENMELDYDAKDLRYDCCRIRSNLCELPTTYITNNCQIAPPLSNIQVTSNSMSEFDSVKVYENCKLSESQNLMNMSEKHSKFLTKPEDYTRNFSPPKLDNLKPHYNLSILNKSSYLENHKSSTKNTSHVSEGGKCSKLNSTYFITTPSVASDSIHNTEFKPKISQEYYNENQRIYQLNLHKIPDVQKLPFPKPSEKHTFNNFPNNHLSYDTSTFFDKVYDTSSIKDRYTRDIELLRSKLKELRNKHIHEKSFSNLNSAKEERKLPSNVVPKAAIEVCDLNKELGNKSLTVRLHKETLVGKKEIKSVFKVPVKARGKLSVTKLRKIRSKIPNNSLASHSDRYVGIIK